MKLKVCLLSLIGIFVLLIGMLASICIGAKNIPISEIYNSIFHYDNSLNAQLVVNVRIPRILCAFLVGGMLSLSGTIIQGIMQNPIADSSIMGVTQGASLAILISTIFPIINIGAYNNFIMALVGTTISGTIIFMFALYGNYKKDISKILIASTSISTLFLSLTSMLALIKNRSSELAFWVSGSFNQSGWIQVYSLIIIGGFFSVLSIFMAKHLNLLILGDEFSTGLGISPSKIKLIFLLLLIPICSICVAVSGNISFIGLFIPHIIRKIVGNNYKLIMPLSFLFGSILLVFSDILARSILSPYELPVGLFTSIIGIPVFLLLIRKENV